MSKSSILLGDLGNVNTSGAVNGDALQFNSATASWGPSSQSPSTTTLSTTFSGPCSTTASVAIRFNKIGNMVFMTVPAFNATFSNNPSATMASFAQIPATFAPPSGIEGDLGVVTSFSYNNGTDIVFSSLRAGSGSLAIAFSDSTGNFGTPTWPTSGTANFPAITAAWSAV